MIRIFVAVALICTAASNAAALPGEDSAAAQAHSKNINQKSAASRDSAGKAASRSFTFHYRFRVKGLNELKTAKQSDSIRVWLPCPSSSNEQQVKRLEATAPGKLTELSETKFGNKFLFLELESPKQGEFTVDVPYEFVRHEVHFRPETEKTGRLVKLDANLRSQYLSADKMVPTTGKPLRLLSSIQPRDDKLELARQLYDLVDGHVTYKKEGTGWGRGDTNWVCDSGYGNCTDFHSLFISLARSQEIPARFEIGFSIPTNKPAGPISGYHCWAWFYIDDRGWIPVDISEADKQPQMKEYYFGNLTADRVTFSTGRDLQLMPAPTSGPLNFFIYPYIEVGGQQVPQQNIELQFTFQNIP